MMVGLSLARRTGRSSARRCRRRLRPRGGGDDGDRRRPRDRRGRSSSAPRSPARPACSSGSCSASQPLHGLQLRAEGLHGGRRRRDRQHPRRDARRPPDRARRGVRRRATSRHVQGPDRLLDPDRRDALAPDRAPRQGGRSTRYERAASARAPGAAGAPDRPRSASTSGSRASRPRERGRPSERADARLERACAGAKLVAARRPGRAASRSHELAATRCRSASTRSSTRCSRSA